MLLIYIRSFMSLCSIKLGQFLLTDDGHVKLNDFNRAEIMLFNEKDQEYCPYITAAGGGVWRAPEEYAGKPLDEKIDVWSMGTLLDYWIISVESLVCNSLLLVVAHTY